MITAPMISWEELIGETDRILGEVQQGASFVVTVDGKSVAILRPIDEQALPN